MYKGWGKQLPTVEVNIGGKERHQHNFTESNRHVKHKSAGILAR